jgi:hypothetical protein
MSQIHDGFAYLYLSGGENGQYQLYVLVPSFFRLKGVGFGDASTYVGGLPSTTTRIEVDLEGSGNARQYHVCRYDLDLNSGGFSGDTTIIVAVNTIEPGGITTHETKILYADSDTASPVVGFQAGKHIGSKIDKAPYTLLKYNATYSASKREPSVLVHCAPNAAETQNATSAGVQVKAHTADISGLVGNPSWNLCTGTQEYDTYGPTGRFESEVVENQQGGGPKKRKRSKVMDPNYVQQPGLIII